MQANSTPISDPNDELDDELDDMPADGRGEMSVMGKEGDTKFTWNVKDETEMAAAKATWDLYKGKGFAAFRMKRSNKGVQMHEFDPKAGRILFVPPLQGG